MMARLEPDRFGEISSHCVGIIFLGTPHRPSRKASWPKLIANIASIGSPSFVGKSHTGSRKNVERGASEVEKISSQFADQLLNIHIASFVEQQITSPAKKRVGREFCVD